MPWTWPKIIIMVITATVLTHCCWPLCETPTGKEAPGFFPSLPQPSQPWTCWVHLTPPHLTPPPSIRGQDTHLCKKALLSPFSPSSIRSEHQWLCPLSLERAFLTTAPPSLHLFSSFFHSTLFFPFPSFKIIFGFFKMCWGLSLNWCKLHCGK